MTNSNRSCPVCGRQLPNSAPGGMCPRCLLDEGLREDEEPEAHPASAAESARAPASDGTGVRWFGEYELLEEIAHGGMGAVFKARQMSINRIVALKIILTGKLASADEIARFRAEAEAAAHLDHPNIVPIYEVGEHEGQSYFTMRFVAGGTLADRMGEFQLLGADRPGGRPGARPGSGQWTRSQMTHRTSQIARFLLQVARAVHHAHQRGILHRDLKPGNILIDARNEPYVTDFGLAKALDRASDVTRTASILGSPGYMAPEQAAGHSKDLSTAADIFSLGAILYELLGGRPPFRGATPMETLRAVMEKEPKRLRLLNPWIDPDLETICLKCLEKDPSRRYASADALANDLEHWVRHEPIRARPVSTWEHTRKWLRRRPPIFFAMSTAVILSLTGGLTGILWQLDRAWEARGWAEEERLRAEASEQAAREAAFKARQMVGLLTRVVGSLGPPAAMGRDARLRWEFFDSIYHILAELNDQPLDEANLRVGIGNVYAELGHYVPARRMHEEALRLRQNVLGMEHPDVAASLSHLATVYYLHGHYPRAEEFNRRALALRHRLLGDEHIEVAQSRSDLGEVLRRQNRFDEAERLLLKAVAIRQNLSAENLPRLAVWLDRLGQTLADQRKHDEAWEVFQEAALLLRGLGDVRHSDLADVARSLSNLSRVLPDHDDHDRAHEVETVLQEVLQIQRLTFCQPHPHIAFSLERLGRTLRLQGKLDEAEIAIRDSLSMWAEVVPDEHPDVATALNSLGLILAAQNRMEDAEAAIRKTVAIRQKLFHDDHPDLAASVRLLSDILRAQGKSTQLESLLPEA